jgi:prepilin-type N-terminal cleavage/methylation domain-containing protein
MTDRRTAGFTLLEVMLAVAIMAISLAAIFSAEAGSVKMAHRARKLSFATLLARCKMGELEEDIMKKGLPASPLTDDDDCCKDAPIEGFKCKTEIVPIVLPDTMFKGDDEEENGKGKKPGSTGSGSSPGTPSASSGGSDKKGGLSGLLGAASGLLGGGKDGDVDKALKDKDSTDSKDKDGKDKDGKDKDGKDDPDRDILSGDPARLLAGGGGGDVDGISAMAMQYVYPILKPSIQSQIRRVSVTVEWMEGSADKTYDLSQYYVAEQPVPLATDPNDPNGTGLTGTGTGTGTGAAPGTSGTNMGLAR